MEEQQESFVFGAQAASQPRGGGGGRKGGHRSRREATGQEVGPGEEEAHHQGAGVQEAKPRLRRRQDAGRIPGRRGRSAAPEDGRAQCRRHGEEAAGHLGLRVLRQEPAPARLRQPQRRRCSRRSRRGSTTPSTPARRPASSPTCGSRSTQKSPRRASRVAIEDNGPGHRAGPGAEDLRQPALRLEVPPPAPEPRPAGHRHQRGRACTACSPPASRFVITTRTGKKTRPAHHFEMVIDTKSNEPEGQEATTRSRAGTRDHGTRVEIELEGTYRGGQHSVDAYIRADLPRQPARRDRLRAAEAGRVRGDRARLPARDRRNILPESHGRRSSPIPTESSWAC